MKHYRAGMLTCNSTVMLSRSNSVSVNLTCFYSFGMIAAYRFWDVWHIVCYHRPPELHRLECNDIVLVKNIYFYFHNHINYALAD